MDINVSLNKLKVVNSVVRQPSFEKIEFDSRKVGAGDMFVAIVGTTSDGHDFIETAIGGGAKMIVCEKMPENGSYVPDVRNMGAADAIRILENNGLRVMFSGRGRVVAQVPAQGTVCAKGDSIYLTLK